jgi:hypothetical protein
MQAYLQEYRIEQLPNFLQGDGSGANILPASKACYYSQQEGLSVEDSLTKTTHCTLERQ